MRLLFEKINRIIGFFEDSVSNFRDWFFAWLMILFCRIFVMTFFVYEGMDNGNHFFSVFFLGDLVFFLFSFLLPLYFLYVFTKEKISKLAGFLLWGQWIIVFYPLLDKMIFRDVVFLNFYLFAGPMELLKRFFLFFGPRPDFGITYGARAAVFLASISLGYYVYLKRKKIKWLFFAVPFFYFLFYFIAILPSLAVFLLRGFRGESVLSIKGFDVAGEILSFQGVASGFTTGITNYLHFKMAMIFGPLILLILVLLYWKKEKSFFILKNIRFPQMFFNFGLFLLGLNLALLDFSSNFSWNPFFLLQILVALFAVFFAWLSSVVINDVEDLNIDKLTNVTRPLPSGKIDLKNYEEYGLIFLLLSLFFALIVGKVFFLGILAYAFLTWGYSKKPFKFKRFVWSSFWSSFSSLIFLFLGYYFLAGEKIFENFPWRMIIFLFFAYSFAIPLKDIKDIWSDKKEGNSTWANFLGEEKLRFSVSLLLLVFYLSSGFLLRENSLFLPSLFFGLGSYFYVSSKAQRDRLLWGVLLLVFFYGIILVKLSLF